MPYPESEHFFKVCADNASLGAMGPGFPLFFEFVKRVGYLMAILTVIYFLPSTYMMYLAYQEIKGLINYDESVIGLYSFGAFVYNAEARKTEFVDY